MCRTRAGGATLAARLIPVSQLPSGVRVQAGVATGRDLRGVRRNRRRRQLLEAFRQEALPLLEGGLDDLPHDRAVIVMVLDGPPARRSYGKVLQRELSQAIPVLTRRLHESLQPETPPN
ncbi:MAG: hypothetical protein HKN29_16000 [Rhodothermales bacterium]|nr:hypothetical protein [Rhodothermales bacterium]